MRHLKFASIIDSTYRSVPVSFVYIQCEFGVGSKR
jgi:hypothetical protein